MIVLKIVTSLVTDEVAFCDLPTDMFSLTRIGNQIEPNDYPYIAGSEGKLPAICGLLSIRSLTDELPAISGSGSIYSWRFIRDICVFFYSVDKNF